MSRGLVGMLVTNRDADVLEQVLRALDASLGYLMERMQMEVVMIVSTREDDRKAVCNCKKFASFSLKALRFLYCDYAEEWDSAIGHSQGILESITKQRNRIMKCAQLGGFDWLLFLDSDILLQKDTLYRLLRSERTCIAAAYMPRWSKHVTVGVFLQDSLQFVINPQLIKTCSNVLDVGIIGMGCTLLRKDLFTVPFCVKALPCHVQGEDIGFCLSLKDAGFSIGILSEYFVEHLSGGNGTVFIPNLDMKPLLSNIRPDQFQIPPQQLLQMPWRIGPPRDDDSLSVDTIPEIFPF